MSLLAPDWHKRGPKGEAMDKNGEPDVGHIYRSLRNSKARNKAFSYIAGISRDEPKKVSSRKISDAIGYSERAVLGALVGDGKKYSVEDSLVRMGLMAECDDNSYGHPQKLFSSTLL